jgi:hypothetical protein
MMPRIEVHTPGYSQALAFSLASREGDPGGGSAGGGKRKPAKKKAAAKKPAKKK